MSDLVFIDHEEYVGVGFEIVDQFEEDGVEKVVIKPVALPRGRWLPEGLRLHVEKSFIFTPSPEPETGVVKKKPTAKDVRDLMDRHNLTSESVGHIIDVDTRTVRRYTSKNATTGASSMPWSSWILLRLYIGELTIESYIEQMGLAVN